MLSPVHLKLELAVRGMRLSDELANDPAFERSPSAQDFAARDIELVLPQDIVAECPVDTAAAQRSPYELFANNDRFFLRATADNAAQLGDEPVPVSVIPAPAYYRQTTTTGTPMWKIGTVHAGYLSIDPAASCSFADKGLACEFCTMQAVPTEAGSPGHSVDEVIEVVEAAFTEGVAEFVYFHTGYFVAEDGGFAFLEDYVRAVKRHFNTLVAVQVHPPRDNRWIDRTYASGADAISYNIEIYDAEILARICRGRDQLIGRDRYYEALEYASKIFPSGTIFSDLIVGLEPPESTCRGIDNLVSMGVLPVLSLFRPLDETALRDHPPPDPDAIAPIYAHLYNAVRDAKLNLQFMRDLGYAITPIEARFFAGADAKLDVAVNSFYKSKIGSRAVRGLSKLRRRLRVRRVSDSFDSSHL